MISTKYKNTKELTKYLDRDGTTDRAEYWVFKFPNKSELPIVLVQDEGGIYIDCTCKHCSIHVGKYLCAYKVALMVKIAR